MKKALVLITFFLSTCLLAQNAKIWDEYVKSKENGSEPILPDFSYAGYMFSEVPIPKVNYKVFNIEDFGAVANDGKSDKLAIVQAISKAEKNGEGIIYFPKGRYDINTDADDSKIIYIRSSRIVFRGEGEQSILFFNKDLPAKDPEKMWTVPFAIQAVGGGGHEVLTKVVSDARRETFEIEVDNAKAIKEKDWVVLYLKNNDKDLVAKDLSPRKPDPTWTSIIEEGVVVKEIHLVDKVQGNKITFYDPIHYDVNKKHDWSLKRYSFIENVGFENLQFEGAWTEPFVHHKDAQHDGGWSILKMDYCVNSWIKDCTFKNVSRVASFLNSAACTALNNKVVGNPGHNSMAPGQGSTGVLIAKLNDEAGMWHAGGVSNNSPTRTVVWRSKHPAHTCFESHASQPRTTLLDNMEGGFFLGRGGGARFNLPNHGKYLVLWNYKETDEAESEFSFWSKKQWYWKIVEPIVVGFHGSGTTFESEDVGYEESTGTPVKPTSLFEAQLELRLGKLPEWIEQVR